MRKETRKSVGLPEKHSSNTVTTVIVRQFAGKC